MTLTGRKYPPPAELELTSVCRFRKQLANRLSRFGREHRRAQANRRFIMGPADLRAYYQARVAGMSDFRKKLMSVRHVRARSSVNVAILAATKVVASGLEVRRCVS
jgi:hypothetical protein